MKGMIIVGKLNIKNLDKRPPQRKKIQNNNAKIMFGLVLDIFFVGLPIELILGNTIFSAIIACILSVIIVKILKHYKSINAKYELIAKSFLYMSIVRLLSPWREIIPVFIILIWMIICLLINIELYKRL